MNKLFLLLGSLVLAPLLVHLYKRIIEPNFFFDPENPQHRRVAYKNIAKDKERSDYIEACARSNAQRGLI